MYEKVFRVSIEQCRVNELSRVTKGMQNVQKISNVLIFHIVLKWVFMDLQWVSNLFPLYFFVRSFYGSSVEKTCKKYGRE